MVRYSILLLLLLTACIQEDLPDVNEQNSRIFEDNFESDRGDLADLFPNNQARWTNLQLVDPTNSTNAISLVGNPVLSGNYALKIFAAASDSILSKAAIEKGGLRLDVGAIVTIESNFYISSTENLENLLLIDLECCTCWDPKVPDNQCPGIRLMMKNNDFLSIERGKILGSTLSQSISKFPRNEWVKILWRMQLDPTEVGLNELWINDQLVLSERGMNMPNARLFAAEAAQFDLGFQLQEPVFYERFQIGATANPTAYDLEIYVDDVRMEVE